MNQQKLKLLSREMDRREKKKKIDLFLQELAKFGNMARNDVRKYAHALRLVELKSPVIQDHIDRN